MTTDTEALVRRAYHFAEGDVLGVQGFIDLFAEDGVFNGIGGVSGQESYRGEQLGDVVVFMGKFLPDVHRELHRVNVLGDVVAIELSIRGTFLGPFETPAGVIQPTGAKLDIPTADFWYVRARTITPTGKGARLLRLGPSAPRRSHVALANRCTRVRKGKP